MRGALLFENDSILAKVTKELTMVAHDLIMQTSGAGLEVSTMDSKA